MHVSPMHVPPWPARRPHQAGFLRGRRDAFRAGAARWLLTAVLVGGLFSAMPKARAGWFGWLWPDSRHEELEQVVDVAHKTAAAAGQLVESHSRQAAAQADQNARVAELLGALADERQSLTSHVARFEEASRRGSAVAAAITAAIPAVVSIAAILLGGLAIWAVTRPGPFDSSAAAGLIELAATLPAMPVSPPGHRSRLGEGGPRQRLPAEPPGELSEDDEAELPF